TLLGGMIRRLEIAQSLLHRPAVLFLDEPTVGLDPGARETVWDRVLDLRDSFGTTMVVTSHHMEEIDQLCDRIALIDRGRIVAIGTSAELKARVGPNATLDDVSSSSSPRPPKPRAREAMAKSNERAAPRASTADQSVNRTLANFATQTYAVAAAEVQKLYHDPL